MVETIAHVLTGPVLVFIIHCSGWIMGARSLSGMVMQVEAGWVHLQMMIRQWAMTTIGDLSVVRSVYFSLCSCSKGFFGIFRSLLFCLIVSVVLWEKCVRAMGGIIYI